MMWIFWFVINVLTIVVRLSASFGGVLDSTGLESTASMAAALRASWNSRHSAHVYHSGGRPTWAVRRHSRG
jgi:hypothetical protein